jgi:molybdopterin synthase sulfur carrier subunit
MQIKVKFFASLREQTGIDSRQLDVPSPYTVSDVWRQMTEQSPPENLLCSRNLSYVEWDELLADGDEVAFFPPVTGG